MLAKSNKIEGVISFKDKINDEILDVEDTKVKGTFDYIKGENKFIFRLHINTVVTAPCVITLNPTKILVDFDTDLIYTFRVTDDDSFLIEGNTISLDYAIWSEIILQMPVRVVSEGAEFHQSDTYIVERESPFSSLKEEKEED